MLTDEEIVARVQAGETELFELIFDRHYPRIERAVRGLGLPEADLDDLVAETFLRAFAGMGSFQVAAGRRYLPYLYAIARNLCTDRIRQRQRSLQAICIEDVEVAEIADDNEQAAPLAALLKREQFDHIHAALARLAPADREIIALSYDRDLSSKEIMEIMNKPSVTAVTTHLHKAMKKLRALVCSEGAEDDRRHGGSDAEIRLMSLERRVRTRTSQASKAYSTAMAALVLLLHLALMLYCSSNPQRRAALPFARSKLTAEERPQARDGPDNASLACRSLFRREMNAPGT